MIPEIIKLVLMVILHSTFDTFSSVTLGGSSGASGDDSLEKISHYVNASRIEHDLTTIKLRTCGPGFQSCIGQ
jgi:hypothetical protein